MSQIVMITVGKEKNSVPCFVCEVCQKPIRSLDATLYWNPDHPNQTHLVCPKCESGFEKTHRGVDYTMDIEVVPVSLAQTLGQVVKIDGHVMEILE